MTEHKYVFFCEEVSGGVRRIERWAPSLMSAIEDIKNDISFLEDSELVHDSLRVVIPAKVKNPAAWSPRSWMR